MVRKYDSSRRHESETMEYIDPNNTKILKSIIKSSNETAHDAVFGSRDSNHKPRISVETTRTMVLTAHAHKLIFRAYDSRIRWSSEYHLIIHPFSTYHLLDVVAHR